MSNNIKNEFNVPVNLEQLASISKPIELPADCYEIINEDNKHSIPHDRHEIKLKKYGVLIISLDYEDNSKTFQNIIENIGIPHKHNEKDSFIWDIKVTKENNKGFLARSHQSAEFYLHTDCSYEETIPDYFGLYVLNPDRCGGGQNLIVDRNDLIKDLPKKFLNILLNYPVTIRVPQEFCKGISAIKATIIDKDLNLRYRREIIDMEQLTPEQKEALDAFESLAYSEKYIRLLSLAKNQILLLDNKRYLHARTAIKDENRHLQRMRFFQRPSKKINQKMN